MNKKTEKIPEKRYYDVKVEVMLPATMTYRVFAEDAEEAIRLIKTSAPTGVKHRLAGRRELKLMVYDAGSTILRLLRNLV